MVDVLEWVLRLLLVEPDQVYEFAQLARFGVTHLLHCVDIADIVFPRSWWRAPCLLHPMRLL